MIKFVFLLCFAFVAANANVNGKMRKQRLSLLKTTTTLQPDVGAPEVSDASAICFQSRSRRNHKDLYADPADCHNYFQCQYVDSMHAVGYQRRCAAGLFWYQDVLSCIPEGSIPCTDKCRDPTVAGGGMYRGIGCKQYFLCANGASFGMCCPRKTRFNPVTYLCDDDPTCKDSCSQTTTAIPTTMASVHQSPVRQLNATVCVDSLGQYKTAVAGQPHAYSNIDTDNDVQYCPSGHSFNLSTCRCEVIAVSTTKPTPFVRRKAKLWLPFDATTKDKSANRFTTFLYEGAQYDGTAGYGATTGSLSPNGGYLSIPGLKSFDTLNSGSWAAAFRCNGACSDGAILSNNKDASSNEFTVQIYLSDSNTINARLNFWEPAGTIKLTAPFYPAEDGWTHVAVTYDGNVAEIYVDGYNVGSENVAGYLQVAHCAFVVGTDQTFGPFNGNIDSVLVTPFALTSDEVVSLYQDQIPAKFL